MSVSDYVHRGGGRWVLILLGWTLTPRGWVLTSSGIHGPGILRDMVDQRAVCILLECFLITAHKWSLGQGNIFTCVCHSIHRGRGLSPGGLPDRDAPWTENPLNRDPPDRDPPLYGGERAVRILLECILVNNDIGVVHKKVLISILVFKWTHWYSDPSMQPIPGWSHCYRILWKPPQRAM